MKHRVLAVLLTALPALAALEGSFSMEPASEGRYRLTLERTDTLAFATRVLEVPAAELRGFDAGQARPHFDLVRVQGTLHFEGTSGNGQVTGRFRFVEDPSYIARLKGTSARWWDSGTNYEDAVFSLRADLSLPPPLPGAAARGQRSRRQAAIEAYRRSGYPLLDTDLDSLRRHNVSPELLRQLKLSGYDSMSTPDMVKLKTNGVDSWDLEVFRSRGLTNLSADEMVNLKNNGLPKQ